jgi:hypothetical protein
MSCQPHAPPPSLRTTPCLLSATAYSIYMEGVSCTRNLRTRHAVVTGDPLSMDSTQVTEQEYNCVCCPKNRRRMHTNKRRFNLLRYGFKFHSSSLALQEQIPWISKCNSTIDPVKQGCAQQFRRRVAFNANYNMRWCKTRDHCRWDTQKCGDMTGERQDVTPHISKDSTPSVFWCCILQLLQFRWWNRPIYIANNT